MRGFLIVHAAKRAALTIVRDIALHDAGIQAVRLEFREAVAAREKAPFVAVDFQLDLEDALQSGFS